MNENQPQARVVIVAAVDATSTADQVLATATGLAQSIPGAELHLLHVVEMTPRDGAADALPTATEALEAARARVDAATATTRERFGGRVAPHLAVGVPWREIVQLATNLDADLVVVGTHDRKGLSRLVLGSVAEQVAKKAPCAVLVARKKDYHGRDVPEIEPACPDCRAVQRETGGAQLWCARHAEHHAHGRLHYESPPAFGVGSMLIRS